MPTDPAQAKQRIRDAAIAALASLPPPAAAARSAAICERVLSSPAYGSAGSLLIYAPLPGEADILPIADAALAAGKLLAFPRTDWSSRGMLTALVRSPADLVPGRYGLREPRPDAPILPLPKLDLILVPGLAFDTSGGRLGRGAGFYDRFLASPALAAATCGVCFELQLIDRVPIEPWDIPLNFIATEDRLIEVS